MVRVLFQDALKSPGATLSNDSKADSAFYFKTLRIGGSEMSLVSYEPWLGVRQLQDDINRLFSGWSTSDSSGVTADWVPNVDINEFEDKFQLYVDVPGVEPKDVDITLENGVLTISGERFVQAEKADENVVRRRTERGTGRFYRRFILPESVDPEKVKATDRHGVLEILIPKQAKALPRKIEVAA
jgi:HSP20 family protein